jgi:hypothetical protein
MAIDARNIDLTNSCLLELHYDDGSTLLVGPFPYPSRKACDYGDQLKNKPQSHVVSYGIRLVSKPL